MNKQENEGGEDKELKIQGVQEDDYVYDDSGDQKYSVKDFILALRAEFRSVGEQLMRSNTTWGQPKKSGKTVWASGGCSRRREDISEGSQGGVGRDKLDAGESTSRAAKVRSQPGGGTRTNAAEIP